jgi:hypothetical protein
MIRGRQNGSAAPRGTGDKTARESHQQVFLSFFYEVSNIDVLDDNEKGDKTLARWKMGD